MMPNDLAERRINHAHDNEAKLEALMDAYGDSVKGLIYSYVRDWGIASDLVQDVFVAVYLKLDSFSGRSSYKTWLYAIAINRSRDYVKSWHHRHISTAEKIFSFLKDKGLTPEEEALANDSNQQLLKAVWSLPFKYREVLLLHYYQDLSIVEISETLDLSPSTVKTRLYRAQDKLRKTYTPTERGGNCESV
ncbi:RNA polymerase factor sigma C [Bacillus sp. FJAT-18017]|uniref:sigma-70 family RNA polymerase sigma factor n=1 Tax=Bacillus sp. FJAT-18017 TaxID=1705566 RepID=UPI0006AF7961|nr:sigma-70 family RNA polymerase sigma factor [Bacillus sp. FJAT-18017]ALC89522.1 RNA polymerase factor sigma C [Bacillus sp. FJAT-18017]